ncbi:phosphoribosylformylglycinamidine synthase subunit PurL [Candidatus Planktophila versatilis]|uniref:Phosphoribosylformylglycinamidine synthase subunit PurL n=1 Tax=Candidatus Planktophila versatilis TaxID=1884905 RepID=A0ABM6MFV9_9ACTN|nr:phosphoribosylformylglycinamidine synthase subunit PurL [Candidatus Planktophila versatilis]ASY17777.1 phosphoribosylformylglycinamidine synthase [Candidatus Planktophila versatilis]
MALDTVAIAQANPDATQPFAELGLKADEYASIKKILGRRPTSSELAMYSVMWSEHCSYKSSKVHLKQFGEKAVKSDALLVGIGENAGVVDVGQGYAVTFKIESHNHPSFIEPYQGAATGVGGIVRDILTMGARPIAIMDPLRFGPADAPDTRRVLPGIIAGVGGYGNCLGLPNIGGEVVFDETYIGNPLVNALCVGVMKHSDIKLAKAAGAGNLVVLYGAKTGGDGIGGVSVLASETFESKGPAKRPAVQVGDPFVEKVLIECSLEIFAEDLVVGIQDLGGAGLSCATSELASGGSGGMKVQLDKVPLRDPSLSPEEILMSESQERMCAIVEPSKIARFLEICEKWDVTVNVIGEVTDGNHLEITWNGELIVDVPPRTVAHDGPVYNRPLAQPAYIDAVAKEVIKVPIPSTPDEIKATILKLAATPNLADKSWVTNQYDRYVQGNTIQSQPDDSGMVRIDEKTHLGVAVATDANANWSYLNPYQGAKLALAEAARNIATAGAKPLAVTNCLNFGSPEDPGVMWQFAESVRGLADGCLEMGLPITGGNVSFYNQTGSVAILPTPVIGVLGVIDDVRTRTPMSFDRAGLDLYLLGETKEDLAGSEWAYLHNQRGGIAPIADLQREMQLIELLVAGRTKKIFTAAHDLSQGGLAATLTEMVLRHHIGATIQLENVGISLLSESPGRVVVAIDPAQTKALTSEAAAQKIALTKIGVTGGDALVINGAAITLAELHTAHTQTFPKLFG